MAHTLQWPWYWRRFKNGANKALAHWSIAQGNIILIWYYHNASFHDEWWAIIACSTHSYILHWQRLLQYRQHLHIWNPLRYRESSSPLPSRERRYPHVSSHWLRLLMCKEMATGRAIQHGQRQDATAHCGERGDYAGWMVEVLRWLCSRLVWWYLWVFSCYRIPKKCISWWSSF